MFNTCPRRPHRALAIAFGCSVLALASMPAAAQDEKELLRRSQSQSQQRAVEDLIRKLQGGSAAPAQTRPQTGPETSRETARQTPPKEPAPQTTVAPAPAAVAPAPVIAVPAPTPVVTPAPAAAAPASPSRPRPLPNPAEFETPSFEPPAPAPVSPALAPGQQQPAPTRPQPQPQRIETARIDALPSVDIEIYFDYNSDVITPQAASTLAVLAQALSDARLAGSRFLIGGHTDAKGGAQFNLGLSQRRAESVRRFLIERHGVEADRLVAEGFGQQRLKLPSRPMALENRRVQVVNLTAQ